MEEIGKVKEGKREERMRESELSRVSGTIIYY